MTDIRWETVMDAKMYGLDQAKETREKVMEVLREIGIADRVKQLHAGWNVQQAMEVVFLRFKNGHEMAFSMEWFEQQPTMTFVMVSSLDNPKFKVENAE
jgi:hypothetical protein